MGNRKKLLYVALMLAGTGLAIELTAWLAFQVLGRSGVVYRPPTPDTQAVEDYLDRRDPVLGWPSPTDFGTSRYDASGSRRIPAFVEPGGACIALYGDSFTYGVDVADEEAWSNRLSLLLGCRVANYGVGGYGSDQATLRFETRGDTEDAPVVILGHLSENILRNLNRYRSLVAPGDAFGLKPRFKLTPSGALDLIPIPAVADIDGFRRMVGAPGSELTDDYFVPGGDSGIQTETFPFSVSLMRALGHYHIQAKLRGEPAYAAFYQTDHPARGVELTARILERFAAMARERDKRPVFLLIPTGLDLMEFRRSGRWVYAPLIQRARDLGIELVDLGPRLDHVVGDDPCSIFIVCNGHMNARGHELLARQVAIALDQRGIREEMAARGRWPYPIARIDPVPLPSVASGPPGR